jgi:hypothetical protein
MFGWRQFIVSLAQDDVGIHPPDCKTSPSGAGAHRLLRPGWRSVGTQPIARIRAGMTGGGPRAAVASGIDYLSKSVHVPRQTRTSQARLQYRAHLRPYPTWSGPDDGQTQGPDVLSLASPARVRGKRMERGNRRPVKNRSPSGTLSYIERLR